MAISVLQNPGDHFSYKGMKILAEYLNTFNMASQTLAIDANSNDIQTTGTGWMMMNGQFEQCEVDAALDISAAHREDTKTAWATSTSYSAGDIRWNAAQNVRYRCILAHTSKNVANETAGAPANEPGASDFWDTYWEEAPHSAVYAGGTTPDTIAAGYDKWYLVTAEADGTLGIWIAGDAATTGNAVCKIPQFDPKMYCAIGAMLIANGTSSTFTVGTTGLDTASVTDTYINIIGPVFPHPDNWDMN